MVYEELEIEEISEEDARCGERVHAPSNPTGFPVGYFDAETGYFMWLTRWNGHKKWWRMKVPTQFVDKSLPPLRSTSPSFR